MVKTVIWNKFSEYFDVYGTQSKCNCITGIDFVYDESFVNTIKSVHSAFEGKDNSFLSEFCAHCTDEGISSVINENDFLDSTDISDNNSINSDFDN